ncbi:MAG TPA: glycosyltransferase family 4 protein [Dyella sp.]|uniref:glycosyltransferase family 4 protein n=1 Tax=Dyella sp. TaxID=1869338 RepID=UPI002F950063
MKVLIVNNMAPFVWGGAEELAANLERNLILAGHQAEILRVPFQWEPAEAIPTQMLMMRAFELWNVDRVIALKFPAYLIRHPHKTLWLVHQYRQAYDLFDAGQTNLPPGEQGEALRSMIREADQQAFAEMRSIYTISDVTKARLARYNGREANVLVPPVNDPERFIGGESQGYVLAAGRVNAMKRQHLLVEAMRYTSPKTKLLVAGPPDSAADADALQRLVDQHDLGDRVKLDLRFLSRDEYAAYVNGAQAVAYVPYDEDALAYVTMEASQAGKALISACDSGGVLGLARHGETGWVAMPHPEALAGVLDQAFADSRRTQAYGDGARERLHAMDINWPSTVGMLLQ